MKKIPVWISILIVGSIILSFSGGGTPVRAQQPQENLSGAATGGEAPPVPEVGTVYPSGMEEVAPYDTQPNLLGIEGITPQDLTRPLSEGFETGTLGQFTSSVPSCIPGGCGWTVNSTAHSGSWSAHAPNVSNISDQRLVLTEPVAIPSDATAARLTFWHNYQIETSFDGGILEVSTNGGSTWTQITSFLAGGYTGTVSGCCGNPLGGLTAWTGSQPYFSEVMVDLLPYAGQNVLFRFRLGTDNIIGASGWWIDDISVNIASPVSCQQAAWMQRTAYPITVLDEATVTWGGMLYGFGGGSNYAAISNSYRYYPGTNSWTAISPLPAVRDGASAVTDGTYIYILGGWDASANVTNTLYRYNPSLDSYITLSPYSQPTSAQAAVYLNGNIYRIGGCTSSGCSPATASMEVYNIAGNSWATAPSLPSKASWLVAMAYGGYIYVAGGLDELTSLTKTYRFDPGTNSWDDAAIADLSVGRWGSASGFLNGKWMIAGGYVNNQISASVIGWDPLSGGWSVLDDMLQAQARTRGGSIGSAFYVVGGRKPTDVYTGSTDNQRFQDVPCQACQSFGWTPASGYPQGIVRYGFGQLGDEFYIFGGVSDGDVVNTVRKFNTQTNTWIDLAPLPVAGEALSAAYWNGKFYVTQGAGGTAFQAYDIATNSWSALAPVPVSNSYGAALGAYNGYVYMAGGEWSSQNTYRYQISGNSWSPGAAVPAPYFLGGYTQVGQYLYLVGGFGATLLDSSTGLPASSVLADHTVNALVPEANSNVTMRLDMNTGTWSTGPAWTMQRGDFALASDGVKLYAMGGDAPGGTYFDATAEVDELQLATWPSGTWVPSPADLPSARQANQAGFYSTGCAGGEIWSTGGVANWVFMPDNIRRAVNGACQSNLCPVTLKISGSLEPGDLVASQRVTRGGVPSSCSTPNTCSVFTTGSFLYDQYPLVNNTAVQQCLSVTVNTGCSGNNMLFVTSYQGSFDPNAVCTNYSADLGSSPNPGTLSYSYVLGPGQVTTVVVSIVNSGYTCSGYDLVINTDKCPKYLPILPKIFP
jgi:N-acetylneuraminic acid mutarotase